MKTFYRVCHEDTKQGLWYDYTGEFTGLIHNRFDFCANSKLEMDFDSELVGFLSATEDLESLYTWFTENDILHMQSHGFFIHQYETDDFKFYERFQHWVISQNNSTLISKITL